MKSPAPLLLLFALGACESTTPAPPARQWTMFDLQEAYLNQQPVLVGAEGFPSGMPYDAFVKGPAPLVPISLAFTEGGYSPYVTTNVWANTPEVWVQPMYILVDGWDADLHTWKKVQPSRWIYTVGPKSRFHSPFWQVYWAELPANGDPARYTSARQILDDKLVLHEGPGRLVTLVPPGTTVPGLPERPPSFPAIKPVAVRTNDLLDGEKVAALDFGENRFEWNESLEVVEQPFFVIVTCSRPGDCRPSGAPNVGGTGPLFTNRPAMDVPGGRPRFGSFWRLYLLTLPFGDDARLYIPPDVDPATRSTIANNVRGLSADPIEFTPDPGKVAEMNRHYLQVALDGATCFKDQQSFEACKWLDSQRAVEKYLPAAITRTGITVTCPFVGYAGMDLPR
jgi:hypothetical protein